MFGELTRTASGDDSRRQKGGFNPFRLDDLVNLGGGARLDALAASALERALGLRGMARIYEALEDRGETPFDFARISLERLNVSHEIIGGGLDNIPAEGPCIVVANHPFGGVDGILAAHLLRQRRADVKVMANGMLKRVPEFSELFVGVNPYADASAIRDNIRPMREAVGWLRAGGLLLLFPAGDVATLDLKAMRIVEGDWSALPVRLARRTNAAIVPLYFGGRNSLAFHLFGGLHPRIRTLMLPRQLMNKRNRRLQVWIGGAIEVCRLRNLGDDAEIARHLRLCVLMLRDVEGGGECAGLLAGRDKAASLKRPTDPEQEVRAPLAVDLLRREAEALPKDRLLAASGDLGVYYAHSREIPNLLQEIGRLREISFRAVGEGSGQAVDIDLYDNYYLQLFIWDRKRHQVAGAYRLGLSDEILARYGVKGLYSHSLFRYKGAFIRALGPAIEMGRSFVAADYQRSYAPLMLLWKGIGAFVAQNPRYNTLFGPVSISSAYGGVSQNLMIDFLKANSFDAGLGRRVHARRPYRSGGRLDFRLRPVWRKTDLQGMQSIEGISELVSLLEDDDKGAPVLIRQYLKMGGRMLGFNVDEQFSDCIDGLMVADLRHAPRAMLNRYMGAAGARDFLAWRQGEGAAKELQRR